MFKGSVQQSREPERRIRRNLKSTRNVAVRLRWTCVCASIRETEIGNRSHYILKRAEESATKVGNCTKRECGRARRWRTSKQVRDLHLGAAVNMLRSTACFWVRRRNTGALKMCQFGEPKIGSRFSTHVCGVVEALLLNVGKSPRRHTAA